MLLSDVSMANHAIWWIMEFWGTATFAFPAVTMFTAWILRNTQEWQFFFLPLNPVAFFFFMNI